MNHSTPLLTPSLFSSFSLVRRVCLLALFLLCSAAAWTQPVAQGYVAFSQRLKFANELLSKGDLYNAMLQLSECYKEDPDNVEVIGKLASAHYQLRDYKKSEIWYARLLGADKGSIAFPEARYWYARSLKLNGKYEAGASEFRRFINEYKGKDETLRKLSNNEAIGADQAVSMLRDTLIKVYNVGTNINSPFTEFSPLPVGNDLYYASIRTDSIVVMDDPKRTDFYAMVYRSHREGNSFTPGELVPGIGKIGYHTGNLSISPDLNTLYFTRCELKTNVLSHCDIYQAKRNGNEWTDIVKLKGINNESYTAKHPAYGKLGDKEGLFFSSDRPDGYGGWDLYFAPKKDDEGTFGTPKNLGQRINTVGSEETPFFRDSTLYFCSDGHPTIGGFDIFSVKRNGNAWEEVKNMGKGINSRVDDRYYVIAPNGWQAYVVSNRPGTFSLKSETCCDDIFTIRLPFMSEVRAVTLDRDSKQPLAEVAVQLIDIGTGKKVEKVSKESAELSFKKLPMEHRYKLYATHEGYYPDSTTYTTVALVEPSKETKTFQLKKLPPPPPVVVRDTAKPATSVVSTGNGGARPLMQTATLGFAANKASVAADQAKSLERLAKLLKDHPTWTLQLVGHVGAGGANNALAAQRTEATISFLVTRGIDPTRIRANAPIEDATLPNGKARKAGLEGNARNRRIDIQVMGDTPKKTGV